MVELDELAAERNINAEILALFNEGHDIEHVLDRTVAVLAGYLKCEAIGIRLMDKHGNIPYQTHMGFSEGFLKKEGPLCVRHDKCACIEISKGEYDPALPIYTSNGSFFTNDLQGLEPLREGMKTGRFRGECVRSGWESLALVPIRFWHKYHGLIHVVDGKKGCFPQERVQFLENIAAQVGLYIHSLEAKRETEKEFSSMVNRIMHDLRNPLFSTRMFAELISEKYSKGLPYEVTDFLDRMTRNFNYMEELISALSGFSIICDPDNKDVREIELGVFIRTVVEDMALPDNASVRFEVPDGAKIRYAPLCLKRVLSNLVSNAVKYSSHREAPEVVIGCHEKDLFYQVSVADNGMGMDESEAEKVFYPFYRTDAAAKIPGTGLGLSTCKKIVEKKGGNIWVYSDKGAGSTFYFTVPK